MNTDKDYFDSDQQSINSELIEVVPWQSSWSTQYQSEHDLLHATLTKSTSVCRSTAPGDIFIEHIGSTSVVGLSAKPILDLMIGVEKWREDSCFENTLESLGYIIANPPQQLIPNTQFLFRRNDRQQRTHHLHVVEHKSEFWTTRLLYRDFLRHNKSIAMLYGTLKTIASEQHRYDRIAYNDFKAPFIRACIRAASVQDPGKT